MVIAAGICTKTYMSLHSSIFPVIINYRQFFALLVKLLCPIEVQSSNWFQGIITCSTKMFFHSMHLSFHANFNYMLIASKLSEIQFTEIAYMHVLSFFPTRSPCNHQTTWGPSSGQWSHSHLWLLRRSQAFTLSDLVLYQCKWQQLYHRFCKWNREKHSTKWKIYHHWWWQ